MNRIDRLSAILTQLQSKSVVTAQEIAERFDISLRTVYRDIRALEEGGIPIGAEAGVGYYLMEGYHLPPVMFTQDEANALVLGAKLIDGQTDQSIKHNFSEALLKIKSVLKTQAKAELERLESQIQVSHIPQPESEDFPNNFLATMQQALIDSSVLRFRYYANSTGDFSTRSVEPMGLIFYGNHWHLLAYCQLRQAPRDFRADRIVKLEKLDEHFDPEKRKPFESFMSDLVRGTELIEVELAIDKTVARYISEQKYTWGFVSQERTEDAVVMKFLTPNLEFFSRWLISLGDAAAINSPDLLKEEVHNRIAELQRQYGA